MYNDFVKFMEYIEYWIVNEYVIYKIIVWDWFSLY